MELLIDHYEETNDCPFMHCKQANDFVRASKELAVSSVDEELALEIEKDTSGITETPKLHLRQRADHQLCHRILSSDEDETENQTPPSSTRSIV